MAIRRPRRVGAGAVIGIVAPASPFDEATFQRGLAVLRELRFTPRVPDDLLAPRRYLAAGDAQRARVLERMWDDPAVDAVMCARGGYGCLRLLDRLDADRFAAAAKPFIGFSDITALHTLLNRQVGLATLHAPVVTSLGHSDAATRQALFDALTGGQALVLRAAPAAVIRPGRATGPVAGGNLTTLCHLAGTPFFPDLTDRLLVLEDTGELLYRIDRMLSHLRLAGVLERIAGAALGGFDGSGASVDDLYRLVDERLAGLNVPVLGGLPVGHGPANRAFPLGATATLDTATGELAFHEAFASD